MIKIISFEEKHEWNNIVTQFHNYDVYYLWGYLNGFRIHGDGEPILIYYEDKGSKAMCVLMKRDISDLPHFSDLPKNSFFDATTPYGYGGFIVEGNNLDTDDLYDSYKNLLKANQIISVFYRFHPILKNAHIFEKHMNVVDLGKTISMDLTSSTIIWDNIHSKNRNMIRKAIKNGVVIKHGKDPKSFEQFIPIYEETMDNDNASSYYYFSTDFYNSIHDDLPDNYEMFWAVYQDEIIAMSIMLHTNGFLNYHLSGSRREYRNLAPTNLLLYEAACWGHANGFTSFHLGGGVGSQEDSLYKFKKSFNKNADCQFSIGKEIIDLDKYNQLVCKRKEEDRDFNIYSNFFPLYRS